MRKLHTVAGSLGVLASTLGLVVAPALAKAHSNSVTRAVGQIAPLKVEARVAPHRIAHAPYTYTVSGAIDAPLICPQGTDNPAYCMRAPCQGAVRITIHLPHGNILVTEAKVTDACRFSKTITIPDRLFRVTRDARHRAFTLAFEVRYLGNSVLSAQNAPTVFAEAVGFH